MLRLLVFPCTLLNMVESLHAGEQPTFPLFLGMALTDLVDRVVGVQSQILGSEGNREQSGPELAPSSSAHLSWTRGPVRVSSCLQTLQRTGLPWTLIPTSNNIYYQATLSTSKLNLSFYSLVHPFCSAPNKDGEQLVSIPCRITLRTLESYYLVPSESPLLQANPEAFCSHLFSPLTFLFPAVSPSSAASFSSHLEI